MTDTKELIQFLDGIGERLCRGLEKYRYPITMKFKDPENELAMLTQIKSLLEQQYQHEQNILNYGTDEPEEEQVKTDELVQKCMDIVMTEPTAYGKECAIRTLLQSRQPDEEVLYAGQDPVILDAEKLYDKIMHIAYDTLYHPSQEKKEEIIKLLSARSVTRGELKDMYYDSALEHTEMGKAFDYFVNRLKSKGIPVKGEK